MTKSVEIVPSTIAHAKELAQNLRQGDRQEALGLGLVPEKAVFFSYRGGLWRRTALIDNQVAAMWGVAGCPMGLVGQPYLITSPVCEEILPIRFARIYKQEVSVMTKLFPILENYVDASYEGAVRMLRIAGFSLKGPCKVPPFDKEFYQFTMVS